MKNKRLPQLLLLLVFVSCAPIINGQLYKFFGDLVTFLINLTRLQSFVIPLYPDLNIPGPADHYDFIIIGSGPSGSTLANRLTENPNIRVLLLENGEEASFVTDIPIVAGALGPSKYNYGYKTEPQEGFCIGCIDKRIFWEHGNALGGSSIINYMLYVRGNKRDYDKWRDLGNPGWGYDDLLPLFKKIEDCQVAYTDPGYRATGGYLTISDVAYRTKVSGAYVQACLEAGMRYVDYNGAEQLGVSYIQATTRTGQRCSAEKAYLRPVHTRPNLTIKTKAKVTKIIISSNNVAQGVEYYKLGIKYKAYADKEVISSAGALNTPQLLMLSGIGPKDHLEKLGINVIKSLPVGQKMYDHATFPVIVFQVNDSIVINSIAEALNPINYVEYPFGKGILTSPGGVEVITYVKVNISTEPDPMWPDIELLVLGGALSSDGGTIFRKIFNISPKIYDKVFKPLENKYVYQATPILLHPRSYGWIELNSSNPFDAPLFYANYFSDPDNFDIKMMIAGIREFERINESPALQKYNSTIVSIPVPGCETEQFDSDAYWECAIRTVVGSYFHQVATCKMGPTTDTEAVVDNQLRVYGIKKLRVVDTSVIPFPPTAHNVAPGYVIGEKAAQLIQKTWNI